MKALTWGMLLGGMVLLFAAQTTEALKCYICVNIVNRAEGCNDPFDKNNKAIEYAEYCESCSKSEEAGVMSRTCLQTKEEDECNDDGSYCTCKKDLCNGGTRVSAPVTFITALIGVAMIFRQL